VLQRIPPGLWYALTVYGIARILTSFWVALVTSLAPVHPVWEGHSAYENIHVALPHGGRIADLLLSAWYRWDTGWYMTIAIHGYGSPIETVIFPPLYPLLVGVLGRLLGGEYLLAGLILSNLAFIGALYLLFKLVTAEFSPTAARRSLVWLAIFPAAFYFLAAYSESLFLLLALATFWAAQRRNWILAAIFAFLAPLARLTGWVLAVPVAWEALVAAGWKPWPVRPLEWLRWALRAWPGLLAAICGPLGLLAYYGYLWLADLPSLTDAFAELWQVRMTWPWYSLVQTVRALLDGQGSLIQGLNLAALLLFLCLTALGIRRLRTSWWLFALTSQVFFLMRDYPVRQLDGTLRYLAVLFPCFVILALVIRNRWLSAGMKVLFVLLQALLLALFARWLWVA
jgi:hypothetical protein